MYKKFLTPALVLVALLTLLAVLGIRAMEISPTFSLAQETETEGEEKDEKMGEEKRVYLTFDDGPSTVVTGKILDVLKKEDVKATFFIVSDRVYNREATLRRIAAEGHTLGVHSATHEYNQIYASDESLLKDVATCENVIARVTGIKPKVYRFPGGGKLKERARQTKLLEELGYRVVGWNAVCGDEEIKNASSERLVKETVKTSEGKSTVILLLHDSATHRATAEALPEIISYYRERGYRFCQY